MKSLGNVFLGLKSQDVSPACCLCRLRTNLSSYCTTSYLEQSKRGRVWPSVSKLDSNS